MARKTILAITERISQWKINNSVLLLLSALAAIIIANSPWQSIYEQFLLLPVKIGVGEHSIFSHDGHAMTFAQFVNDALMAVFFFVVGLEIKQEIEAGELSSWKKAMMPIIAAIGGMVVPVLIFLSISSTEPESLGAAIPMATDIAFALAILGILGDKVPKSLKIFLTALAVVDDIGGIIVIALFYSSHVSYIYILLAVAVLVFIYLAGKNGVHSSLFYYITGFIVWLLLLKSGIHPTIAGVAVALCAPSSTRIKIGSLHHRLQFLIDFLPKKEVNVADEEKFLSHKQIDIVNSIRKESRASICSVQIMEHELTPLVYYFILPLFAFVNAGVTFGDIDMSRLFNLPLSISLGLLVGKAVGIFLFTYIALKLKVVDFPKDMTTANMFAVSIFGGIGFTVSLFIAQLSFGTSEYIHLLNEAKLGIFVGTVASALLGLTILNLILKKEAKENKS